MILEEQRRNSEEISEPGSRQALRTGMMIGTINPREPGSQFWVEFPLPEPVNRVAKCHCEVVWQRRYSREHRYDPGMGLRFLDLPSDMAEAIDKWVHELERQELLLS